MFKPFSTAQNPFYIFRNAVNFLFMFHVKHSGTREQASILEFSFQEIIRFSRLTPIKSCMKVLNFHALIPL